MHFGMQVMLIIIFTLLALIVYAGKALEEKSYLFDRVEKECIAYLDKINAPRNNTCHVFVTYEIKEGEKK